MPVSYAYDGEHVYGHSGGGRKVDMMRENPAVCFEVERVDDRGIWPTVIAWGTFDELIGTDAAASRQLLLARFAPLIDSVGTPSSATVVPRLRPDGTPLPVQPLPVQPLTESMAAPAPVPKPGPVRAHVPVPHPAHPANHTTDGSHTQAVLYRSRLAPKTVRFERS